MKVLADQGEKTRLDKDETLGRDERSETRAKRCLRQLRSVGDVKVHASKFEPPRNSNEISVNRMDLASNKVLAELGKQNAIKTEKKFWGWYTIMVEDVEKVGCRVVPTPSDDNPCHADIVMPVALDTEDSKDALREYARDLAYHAKFLPWGEWADETV